MKKPNPPGPAAWQMNLRPVEDLEALIQDRIFDFVVVGGGGAGAAAAIEATDSGASVLVLEKSDAPGGSTQDSGGSLRTITNVEHTIEHYMGLAQGTTPREVFEVFVAGLQEIPEWIERHGGELMFGMPRLGESGGFPVRRPHSAFPGVPFADALGPRGRLKPTRGDRTRGAALWDFLSRNLAELDVPIVTNARVTRLVEENNTRAITGVEVEGPAGSVVVVANVAVVLCCGGFAWDPEMTRQYFGVSLPALSPPGQNNGDGIRMAQLVGADLWHMSAGVATIGYKFPEFEAGLRCQIPDYGGIMVDQRARRYADETEIEGHSAMLPMMRQEALSGAYDRIPSFVVFDETTRLAGPVGTVQVGYNRDHYVWSADNAEEIARGWFEHASTLDELGAKLGLPGDALRQTVGDFNECIRTNATDMFGRTPARMRAIETPPFYGTRVQPTLLNTQGGPRRNATGSVLRSDGSMIPGLFTAGELGSIWNRLYPGAGNVSECVVSGRLAVKTALSGSGRGAALSN